MESYVKLFDKINIERGTINMFYGNEGNGKTTLAYHLMKKVGGKILYIDSESGRDMSRFRAVCGDEVYPMFVDVYTWIELCEYFKQCVKTKQNYDLIVIDPISFLYLNEILGSSGEERIATLARTTRDIGQIYQNMRKLLRQNFGVGVWINWLASELKSNLTKKDQRDLTEGREFLGGRMAGHAPKSIYRFNCDKRKKERSIEVIKAKNLAEGTKWRFEFTDTGIKLID